MISCVPCDGLVRLLVVQRLIDDESFSLGLVSWLRYVPRGLRSAHDLSSLDAHTTIATGQSSEIR